jgi:hypothetical protein
VPSARGINVITRRRWLALLERVRAGAALYLSLDDGLLAEFEQTFGLRVLARGRRADGRMRFQIDNTEFDLPAPFRLDLRSLGAEVLGSEPDGNPALTRFTLGRGTVTLLTAPLERALAETPGAFHAPGAPPFWQIYQTIAAPLIAARAVNKSDPTLGLTEHRLDDSSRVIVAINYSPHVLKTTLTLSAGWQRAEVFYGEMQNLTVKIPPNDAVVFGVREG